MALQFDKIEKDSVVNNVVNQLTSLIANKELKPGDKIPTETELSNHFGVSRNSIREAIKILKAIGLLEIKRGKGTFVTSTIKPNFFDPIIYSMVLEPKSNKDLYEFRMMLDSMVLISIIDKITDENIIELKNIVTTTRNMYNKFYNSLDMEYYIQQDIIFHKKLLEIVHNPIIERLGNSIMEILPEYIEKSLCQHNGVLRSITNHEEIIHILEYKKRDQIVTIIEKTLVEWKEDWNEDDNST